MGNTMTKDVRKTVNIKDLPVPKGFTIIGSTDKKKDVKDKPKTMRPHIERLPE
jgi:hypothetical protein